MRLHHPQGVFNFVLTKVTKLLELQFNTSPDCLHLVVVGGWVEGLAGLNDLTGYAGCNFMFLVGPPKPDRP